MPTLLRMPEYPAAGQPLRRGWGVAVVDQLRSLNQRTAPRVPPPLRAQPQNLALTWTFFGNVATLSPGLMLMRGELYTVNGGSITLTTTPVYAWLQFAITPGIAPAPELQFATSWSAIDLGVHGRYPLAEISSDVIEGARVVTNVLLHHPGGTIAYPLD